MASAAKPRFVTVRPKLVGCLLAVGICVVTIEAAFPNAHNAPPPGWTGPVFTLSQAFPATLPALEPVSKRPWTRFDFRNPAEAPQYLKAVLDYCLAGNTANNFADVGQNPARKWYHAPWLHSGDSGREFIHGLTKERPSKPPELGVLHATDHDNWAVGFYNARGAFTIGQVWKDPARPKPSKAVFPSHTVSCKLLFTTTPVSEAPFLEGSLEWEADINRASGTGPRPTVRLLQVDLAVKDPRANPTIGWVFGTYQYEKAASTSANWWEHLVPVGLMWGSDVERLKVDQPTRENWINTQRGQKLHLGRKDLVLNGPVDNPRGSCTSCHGFAQVPKINNAQPALPTAPPALTASAATLTKYFTNIRAATPLSPSYTSLDYSLQLQIGIARAVEAGAATLPAPQGALPGAARISSQPLKIPEVTRGQ
jgi:hypothetical protein